MQSAFGNVQPTPAMKPCLVILALSLAACAAFPQLPGSQPPGSQAPNRLKAADAYLAGARAVDRKDLAAAQTDFARAATLDPTRQEYTLALSVTRDRLIGDLIEQAAQARLAGAAPRADALLAQARKIDPSNERVLEHADLADLSQVPKPEPAGAAPLEFLPPIHIVPNPEVKDIHLKGDIHQVVAQLASAFGVKTALDDSVTSQNIRFDLEQTTYDQAMPILLRIAHLFGVAVDNKTLLVAKDTEENRGKFERQVEETVYIPASTPEQLNELTNVVKNVFDIKQAVVSTGSGTLLLRAPEPTIKAVNDTIQDLLDGQAQVVLEIKLYSIDKSYTRNTGATPPTQAGFFNVYSEAQSLVSANQSVINQAIAAGGFTPTGNLITDTILEAALLVLNGLATDAKFSNIIALLGSTTNPSALLTGVYLGSGATLNLGVTTSDTRALDDLTVRVGDRQTTTLRVGEKYPITTSTYSSGLTAAQTAAVGNTTIGGVSASSLLAAATSATIPIIQYEDLGITLKTTPTVLKSGLVSVNIDLKIEALTSVSLDNIPVLTSSNFVSSITVPDGQTAMMLSNLSSSEQASLTGIPGLSDLPGFRQTLADTAKETDHSELVLLVTPHLARRRSTVIASRRIPFQTSVPQEF